VWRARRHRQQPAVLPSLDRLSGLIDRVVELVDAVGDPAAVPAPEPLPEPPREGTAAVAAAEGWLAFLSSPQGYRLVEGNGPAPGPGEPVELEGAPYRVLGVGPSPLPRDRRRCVYAAREEAPPGERTSDA
jgi:hypothetical protein